MTVKIVELVDAVLILGDARIAARGTGQSLAGERTKSVAYGVLAKGQHRFAIRFLVAGVQERIQRERVVFGRGNFLFNQRAENARFDIRELQSHAEMIPAAKETWKRPARMIGC